MGFGELTASVVSGIDSASEVLNGETATLATAAAGTSFGGTALAACCCTAIESTTTETNGKNKITHRIFMRANLCFSLWHGIIPHAGRGGRAETRQTWPYIS